MNKKQITITVPQFNGRRAWDFTRKWLLPNPGTIILIVLLFAAMPAIASWQGAPTAASITTIPYQGRLADAAGQPITSRQNMEFRLYDTPTSTTPLWAEFWTGGNAVNVSDGLFSVMLGSINTGLSAVVQSHSELYLGITIGTDTEMSPRVQLGSVPFSLWSLTVADNSITAAKIATDVITTTHLANGSVTQAKLGADVSLIPPDGSITTTKLSNGAVTSAKIANDAIGSAQIANDAVGSSEIATSAVGTTEIANGSVNTADLADGAVTQSKAPTLFKDGIGTNHIIQFGNVILTNNASDQVYLSFPSCFPNGADVFIPVNSNTFDTNYVVGHTGLNACGATIKLSAGAPDGWNYFFNWIAIGH